MKEVLLRIETHLIETLKWPSWALRLIAVLVALVLATGVLEQIVAASTTPKQSTSDKKNSADDKEKGPLTMTWAFRFFQLQYLTVYLLTMLADWLQGTNMYTLYSVRFVLLLISLNVLIFCSISHMVLTLVHSF